VQLQEAGHWVLGGLCLVPAPFSFHLSTSRPLGEEQLCPHRHDALLSMARTVLSRVTPWGGIGTLG
jgi:hypothetical protein